MLVLGDISSRQCVGAIRAHDRSLVVDAGPPPAAVALAIAAFA